MFLVEHSIEFEISGIRLRDCCLLKKVEMSKHMNLIRQYNHELFTLVVNKKALSLNYDKKYTLEDAISTLRRGTLQLQYTTATLELNMWHLS